MPGVEIVTPGERPRHPEPGEPSRPSFAAALVRGLRRRCPNCGRGRLFRAYLKPVDACESCREALGHIRADDAPPYFTIVVVGHAVVGLALFAEMQFRPPMWAYMTVLPALTLAMTLGLLPVVKGALIGLMWRLRLSGDEFQ
ncbi:MAG: hypothetical protein A3G73_01430 [Rhodospirillales bacterium RIFCSPLOWO2_12_FULL_67_15]|nr:MAG: hypothetical protein A3G73_01430 [Rhodospirillales bacterium RIFCSPLOWO2_12_FULL_67_15]